LLKGDATLDKKLEALTVLKDLKNDDSAEARKQREELKDKFDIGKGRGGLLDNFKPTLPLEPYPAKSYEPAHAPQPVVKLEAPTLSAILNTPIPVSAPAPPSYFPDGTIHHVVPMRVISIDGPHAFVHPPDDEVRVVSVPRETIVIASQNGFVRPHECC